MIELINDFFLDAPDIYNSKFFDNSSSGFGGWGDPANDYQISTGGFKDLIVAYPNPHHIRRNFSLFALSDDTSPPPFGLDPAAPPPPVGFMMNTTMTKENVDHVVNNFEGNFFGFQSYLESTAVSLASTISGFRSRCLTHNNHVGDSYRWSPDPRRVSVLGFLDFCPLWCYPLTDFFSDMAGFCSNGATPPACISGPKWSPNDPLFFMHHAVSSYSRTFLTLFTCAA